MAMLPKEGYFIKHLDELLVLYGYDDYSGIDSRVLTEYLASCFESFSCYVAEHESKKEKQK